MPVDPDSWAATVSAIEKKYDGQIRAGNAYEHPERISTRSLALDIATFGGIPLGRTSRVYGPYSSTKTMSSWNIAAEAQSMGLKVCYWNVEGAYDVKQVQKLGVDVDELMLIEENTIEGIGEMLEALLGVAHVHIIDSCSAAVSIEEQNMDIESWRPGIGARAWGKVFRRIGDKFDNKDNALILIDQVRVNFKTGAEDPAGGRAMEHESSMSLKMKKSGWLWKNKEGFLDPKAKQHKGEMSDQTEPDGMEIKARVEKSRVCRPLIPATMRLDFQKGNFDRGFEYMEAAKQYGVVDARGGGNYYYPANPKGNKKPTRYYGEPALRELVEGNKILQNQIRAKALKTVKER